MRELTLENVISFLNEHKHSLQEDITRDSDIMYAFGEGVDIYYLLEDLEEEFGVTFENFEFTRYFYHERDMNFVESVLVVFVLSINIIVHNLKRLFGVKEQYKPDPNKELCTPVTLYTYMVKNKKGIEGF
ncbi:hypothetical protein NJB85_02385 [Myroides odoratimimus]|uniref:hypothetical protein n=1 Tax=Myroides odoratimimus TaxID=76832 RepID=UPI0020981FA4|nr:hypothetical protein [Myroides odoratimimus]MCO7722025.1 hypothetical protein [Myroides odoratimimus]